MINSLNSDLNSILLRTSELWDEVRGKNIFITGGTGFFGSWLLESFIYINSQLHLNAKVTVLTRDPEKFRLKSPLIANNPSITLYKGNITDFSFPEGEFPFLIHAATEASAKMVSDQPLKMIDTIIDGTRRTLEFARNAGTTKILLTSSGAVYGQQPSNLEYLDEEYCGAPDTMNSRWVYGEGKRTAEILLATYSKLYGIEAKIARCWAFVGPYLPLDVHFAIGNFIRDGLNGGPITIKGDGTPFRSYQYSSDLAVWLWTILFKGQSCRVYNVGSQEAYSIADIAYLVKSCFNNSISIEIAQKPSINNPTERYVPSVQRAISELKLSNEINLKTAIMKTINWNTIK